MEEVDIKVREAVAYITLNRPRSLNALDSYMITRIQECLDQIEDDERIRVLVITGAGRAFCAGADLKYQEGLMQNHDLAEEIRFAESVQKLTRTIEMLSVPTIAAVNGIAVAGGLEIILSCDIVIAVSSARMGDGHANTGMLPGGGSTIRLPRRIPINMAKLVLFTGNLYSADEWHKWGLVNYVVPDGDLEVVVGDITQTIAKKSALGIKYMKELVRRGLQMNPEMGLQLETEIGAKYASSADMLEGLMAFKEHRTPKLG